MKTGKNHDKLYWKKGNFLLTVSSFLSAGQISLALASFSKPLLASVTVRSDYNLSCSLLFFSFLNHEFI